MSRSQNNKRLGDVAEVKTGYTFRGKIEEVAIDQGNAHVVQIKDVRKAFGDNQVSEVSADQLPAIQWSGKASAFVEPGAILLPCRGGYFRASHLVASSTSAMPMVVSSQFLILKPAESVLPEFLCWALNQPRAQHELNEASQGTNIQMLSADAVRLFKLAIPPIEVQEKLLKLNRMWDREKSLTLALLNNREAQLQSVFQQMIKG